MARVARVCRMSWHDLGVLYKDDQPIGGILVCVTDRANTSNVSVNIEDFENARLMGIGHVILRIIPQNWVKIIPMQRAVELMKYARQPEGEPYKLISKFSVEGDMEIPDEDLF
jgi:hypothetical protein